MTLGQPRGMTLGQPRQDERMMAPTSGLGACSRTGRPAWVVVVEIVPEPRVPSLDRSRRRPSTRHRKDARGQSLVEFALVLVPLFILLLGIIQFGFIFNTYVTMTNAAREGARTGTIYVCTTGRTPRQRTISRVTRRSERPCSPR
jgi:hypothetical protein